MRTDPKHITRKVKLTEMLSWEILFIPLQLSTRHSTKSSVRVNLQGRNAKKVKLLLNDIHIKSQAVRLQHHHEDDDLK
jgi:hypothetical protein